jgi:hypothetical protein
MGEIRAKLMNKVLIGLNGMHRFRSSGTLPMARAVGFEPTTDRLTADCSTTELRPIARNTEVVL